MKSLRRLALLVSFLVPLASVRAADVRLPSATPESLGSQVQW